MPTSKFFNHAHYHKKSLEYVRKEGIAASVMNTILDYYLIPFALFKGASAHQIGFLIAVPAFLGSFSQLIAQKTVHFAGSSRLRMILNSLAIQTLMLLPLTVLPLLNVSHPITLLIVLITVYRFLGALIGPAWGSLVSEYLPPEKRGRYFGSRQKALAIAGIAGLAFWGVFLASIKKISPPAAFCLLFVGVTFFRVLSWYYMAKMEDLPLRHSPESHFTFWMFIKRFRESNFVKFVLYCASITFATQLAAPYFSVLMLRDLHFNYLTYMSVNLASVTASLFCFPIWGSHADEVGNAKVLKLTGFLIPWTPFLWTLSGEPVYLIAVEAFTGFVWAGFNLCVTNFIFDAVSPTKRVRCLGYFNLINGMALFGGATLGGFLADKLPVLGKSSLYGLFILSGAARILADFFLSRHFKEVRATHHHKVSSMKLFFSVVGIRPLVDSNLQLDAFASPEQLRPSTKRNLP